MKAILRGDFNTPDNEFLKENTEVEIVGSIEGPAGHFYSCIIPSGKQISIYSQLLEITDYTPWTDWEQIKINAAVSIAQGFAANGSFSASGEDYIAEKSVRVADKLVEKLRGGM